MFAGLIGGWELLLLFPIFVIGLLTTIFWIWMLIHALTNKGLRDMEKLIWVVVLVFTHFLGALIYFFVGRPKCEPATEA
jgi:phospholipase D-like protein